ncbi:hypothetical protein QJS10_CPB17g01812 [Acorus calamus]|uniref:Uncharacterized protein n=1 Tax=Acorus calamus TaxID=4465 RepID=A0AAV9CTG7_ACOCL|nr:hypothetical protein QJS10_CPB17g01812 [Acorus calamus]
MIMSGGDQRRPGRGRVMKEEIVNSVTGSRPDRKFHYIKILSFTMYITHLKVCKTHRTEMHAYGSNLKGADFIKTFKGKHNRDEFISLSTRTASFGNYTKCAPGRTSIILSRIRKKILFRVLLKEEKLCKQRKRNGFCSSSELKLLRRNEAKVHAVGPTGVSSSHDSSHEWARIRPETGRIPRGIHVDRACHSPL